MSENEIKVEQVDIQTSQQVTNQPEFQAFASCLNDLQSTYLNTTLLNGLSSFANFTIPKDYVNQVKKAKELRVYSIIKKILDIKKDYTLPIKEFKCKSKRQQKFYNDNVLPLVKRFARQWVVERHSVSECYAHYGFKNDKKTPMFLRLEDSECITHLSALGFEVYQIKLSPELKEQIKKLQNQKAIDKLPEYLRKAIGNEGYIQDKVTLDYSSMYRSCEDKQDYEFRVRPSILGIAKQLMLREFLIDLHYAAAFSLQKSNITHVKCGSENTPIKDDKTLKAIHETIVNRPPGSAIITTRGDVSINNVSLNLGNLFDPKTFQECNSDILDYCGLPIAFIPSKNDGVNNTTVIIGLKPFAQSIQTDREVFQEFLNVYCSEINQRNGWTEIPQVLYKRINLEDDATLFKRLQFLSDSGVLAFEDICLQFDFDKDEQLEKKKFDWEHRDVEAKTFELSQGLSPLLSETVNQKIEIANKTKQQNNNQSSNSNPDLNLPNNNQT